MIKATAGQIGVHWKLLLVLSFSVLVLAGCGQDPDPEHIATAVPIPATTQAVSESSPPATPTGAEQAGSAPATPTAVDSPTLRPVADSLPPAIEPLFQLISPANNTASEVGVMRVLGRAQAGAVATVNGNPADAASDGSFQFDLPLDEGANNIEIAVTGRDGQTQSRTVQLSFVPSDSALPFSLYSPADGVETRQPNIQVVGATRPDAVVAINGNPVDIGASGIFAGDSSLEEGANLLEVVATDMDGNVRSDVIAVFYIP